MYNKHVALSARMTDFAGFEMPVQYTGIVKEHLAVRDSVGLFDLSHMGEFQISGSGAESFLQRMTSNNVSVLEEGQAQYTTLCYENGGIVDDGVLYKLESSYLLVINASNIEKDFNWLKHHLVEKVELNNLSNDYSLIAIQGPKAREVLLALTDDRQTVEHLPFYHCTEAEVAGVVLLLARTGYTGELGYELYINGVGVEKVWDALWSAGNDYNITAVGLGARDTLRLEMKYCLYGNDIDETTNTIESGLAWITKLKKGDFIGRKTLAQIKKVGPSRRLVPFKMNERGIPRHGFDILKNGAKIGEVTSGTHSPSLKIGIGLGFVDVPFHNIGSDIEINMRGKSIPAEIVKPPFWKNGTLMN